MTDDKAAATIVYSLLRQWASHLVLPIFLLDADGDLLFYNEPAGVLIGRRYDEAGDMPVRQLAQIFKSTDEDGSPLTPARLPLGIAHVSRRPAHRRFRFRALDGRWHVVEQTAFPLIGTDDRHLGTMSVFWAVDGDEGAAEELAGADRDLADVEPAAELRRPPGTPSADGPAVVQRELELILLRRWSDRLAVPVFLVGLDGGLVYYNQPAEKMLGRRYEEAGSIAVEQLQAIFHTTDLDGVPLDAADLPIGIAVIEKRPAHGRIRYQALDGEWWTIDVTAFPLAGQGGRYLGTVTIFWEVVDE